MEPSRFASARLLSRSSYILSALSRSISMMVSRRRSSSCRSFSIIFFSLTYLKVWGWCRRPVVANAQVRGFKMRGAGAPGRRGS
eukprot:scaffold318259_cov28-Tisochrysis_lutea.AAC.3